MTPNQGYGNNDEYQGTVSFGSEGNFDYAIRVPWMVEVPILTAIRTGKEMKQMSMLPIPLGNSWSYLMMSMSVQMGRTT